MTKTLNRLHYVPTFTYEDLENEYDLKVIEDNYRIYSKMQREIYQELQYVELDERFKENLDTLRQSVYNLAYRLDELK